MDEETLEMQIRATARKLLEALLYEKVLQNIPVAGAIGSAGDVVRLSWVQRTLPLNTAGDFDWALTVRTLGKEVSPWPGRTIKNGMPCGYVACGSGGCLIRSCRLSYCWHWW